MSNGRGLDTAFAAAMRDTHATTFVLLQMDLDGGTIRLTDAPHDVTWNGFTWITALGVGTIGNIQESDGEVKGLQFTLSGVPTANVSLALQEDVQGRAVQLRLCALDGTTILVDQNVWEGTLDTMSIRMDGETSTIIVTAEHYLSNWDRPKLLRYSDEDQKLLHPTDRFFEYAARMAEVTVTWPNREFFKQ